MFTNATQSLVLRTAIVCSDGVITIRMVGVTPMVDVAACIVACGDGAMVSLAVGVGPSVDVAAGVTVTVVVSVAGIIDAISSPLRWLARTNNRPITPTTKIAAANTTGASHDRCGRVAVGTVAG